MGGRRKRGGGAPPGKLQSERTAHFLWGLAITAPEHPLVGSEQGPIAAAVGIGDLDPERDRAALPILTLHLRVRAPATAALLALGEQLKLSGIAIRRWQAGDLAGWRFAASGVATLNGAACSGAELARGDRLQSGGSELAL